MLISKKNRVAIYSYLLREGVAVAPKDWIKGNHDEVAVPNLQFCKTMQSLVSRGYVRETFSWYVPRVLPRVLRFSRGQTGSHALLGRGACDLKNAVRWGAHRSGRGSMDGKRAATCDNLYPPMPRAVLPRSS